MPTLPNNPFQNLFGEEKKPDTITPIKKGIPANPFAGMFEAKEQPKKKEEIIQQEPGRELDQFGLPKSTISAAPSTAGPRIKEKESLWTKAAKALLPRSLEVKFGLTAPDMSEQMMIRESARQVYYREKEFNEVLKKEGVDLKAPPKLPEGYKEPEGFFGSLVEGVKFGYSATIKPSIGYLAESIGQEFGSPNLKKWGQEFGDKQVANLLKKPELFAPSDVKGAFEGGLADPRYYGRKMGETVPFVATVMGATVLAGLTKNPVIVKGTAFGTSLAIEKGNAYKDMIDRGIAPDKAATASTIYGTIAAIIENSFGFRPAEIVLGSGKKIVVDSFKKFLTKELPKYSVSFLKNVVVEGGEEGAQQLTQNLITKWLDNSQGIWEGVAESIPAGMIGALPFGATDVIGSLSKYRKLKNDISAKPETQTEEKIKEITDQKAELDFQYELKKENVFEIKEAEDMPSIASINIAQIGDGKFVFDYEANVVDTGLSVDYLTNEAVNSRSEAVKIAKEAILQWAKNEVDNFTGQSKNQLQNIIDQVGKINIELDVPITVRPKKEITIEETEKIKTEIEAADMIYHGARVPVAQIVKEGFIPSEKGALGPGAYFSTSEKTSELHAGVSENFLKINPTDFNFLRVESVKAKDELVEETKTKSLTEAVIAKYGKEYDGVIYTHPDPKVGDTYVIINKEKLDEQIRKQYGKKEVKGPEKIEEKKPEEKETKKEIKTARDAAKDLIRVYVERGDTVSDLSKTQGGNWGGNYHASIGGYVNGKNIGTNKIIVEQIGKQKLEPPAIFSLKELYDEIKGEKAGTQKKKDVLSEEEISDMKKLREKKDIIDKEISAVEKDEARMKAAEELAKKFGPEKLKPRFAKPKAIKKGKELSAIEIAAKIIPKRASLPILSEFRVKDGKLTATDLNVAIRLNSGLANGMYRVIGKDAVKTDTDPADFPVMPEVEGDPAFEISTNQLSQTLKSAVLSIDTKQFRQELTGVFMKIEDGMITVAATDAYRLYVKKVPAKISGQGEFIISEPEKVQKVISAIGGTAKIIIGENAIKFSGSNGDVVVKKIDGTYPDFKQIMPALTTRYSLERPRLLAALKELKPFFKEIKFDAFVGIKYQDGKLILSFENKEQNIKKDVEVVVHGESKVDIKEGSMNEGVVIMPIRGEGEGLKLNADYLVDALNSLENDSANFYINDKNNEKPVLISNESELKSKEVLEKKPKAPSGIASAGASKIGTFEELSGIQDKTGPEMKLYNEVKGLVEKYAKSIGENYTPRNALGVYYPETANIRIKGMNDVSVAAHEITHFLDFAYKISDQLMGVEGYSIDGKPIYAKETAKFRKEMTDIYEKYYPGGKRTHKLKKRMIEGFATLLQKYAEMPATITSEFPDTVREFLMPEGKYYKPVMGDIIKDLKAIVSKYQGLPALDKVGARVINDKVNVNKDSFLNFWQKFKTEIADNIYPLEVLAKKSGRHFTAADPSLWVRQYNNSSALILNNINGQRGFWGWRNGELKKLHDYNWKDLIKELRGEKVANDFGYWLVARREHFAYQELKLLEAIKDQAETNIKEVGGYEAAIGMISTKGTSLIGELKQATLNYNNAKKILDNDGFTEKEVSEAYLANKDRFTEYAKKYDDLVGEDLKFLNDTSVGLVNNQEYKDLSSQEGYASFKRYFYDELVGEEAKPMARVRFGTAKVSSMLKRKGSQKPIINPLFSALTNHAEITRKGLKQIVANRIGNIASNFPDLFQRLQLQAIPDAQGRLIFPQEKDPKIIMARIGGKRIPFLTDATIKRTVDEVLNYQNFSFFEKLLMGSSRFFTKGTTGLFPGFAITNYTVDQVTAAAQTRNKYKVLFDPLNKLSKAIDSENPQHFYLQEYMVMGGERQTMVGWQDMTPNELFDRIGKERAGILKAVDYLNSGMNVLALPSQWSEIMTRATEYIKAREAGKTQIVALEEAGRITAPFHHIGRWGGGKTGQAYIKSIPFFNPAIQVLAQAAETLETKEGRQRYAFVALAITAASIGGLGMIMAFGSDDQKKLFADLNPDELNKYIWLPNPNGKSLIKLRVPDQMAVLATIINMVWADKQLQANYTAGEYLNAGMSWLPAQADISQPAKMFMAWIPQIIKPGALTLAGVKDFPKIMPLESQMLQNRAPAYRYNQATSPVAKWLGKTFNLSPIKIDYLLTGYFGRATGFATGKPGIYNPFRAISREYYFTSGRKIQSFYERKDKNDQAYEAYKKGRKDFKLGERSAILKERAELKVISHAINLFRDIDEDKQPKKAEIMRNKILKLIDNLND